eukprot:403854-Rhodomonas_salina.1
MCHFWSAYVTFCQLREEGIEPLDKFHAETEPKGVSRSLVVNICHALSTWGRGSGVNLGKSVSNLSTNSTQKRHQK